MKRLIAKILFIISFIPFLFCIFAGIVASINGYTYTEILGDIPTTIYGFKAFTNVFFNDLIFFIFIGIIPACMVYQIIYLFISFKNKDEDFE